jgi:hypothetical protein
MPKPCSGGRTQAVPPAQVRPNSNEIARRALELYERRCSIDGWDLDDGFDTGAEPIQERTRRGPDSLV